MGKGKGHYVRLTPSECSSHSGVVHGNPHLYGRQPQRLMPQDNEFHGSDRGQFEGNYPEGPYSPYSQEEWHPDMRPRRRVVYSQNSRCRGFFKWLAISGVCVVSLLGYAELASGLGIINQRIAPITRILNAYAPSISYDATPLESIATDSTLTQPVLPTPEPRMTPAQQSVVPIGTEPIVLPTATPHTLPAQIQTSQQTPTLEARLQIASNARFIDPEVERDIEGYHFTQETRQYLASLNIKYKPLNLQNSNFSCEYPPSFDMSRCQKESPSPTVCYLTFNPNRGQLLPRDKLHELGHALIDFVLADTNDALRFVNTVVEYSEKDLNRAEDPSERVFIQLSKCLVNGKEFCVNGEYYHALFDAPVEQERQLKDIHHIEEKDLLGYKCNVGSVVLGEIWPSLLEQVFFNPMINHDPNKIPSAFMPFYSQVFDFGQR